MVPKKHLAVLVVQHAQWAHFGWGTAGGRNPVRMVMFQQTLEEQRRTDHSSTRRTHQPSCHIIMLYYQIIVLNIRYYPKLYCTKFFKDLHIAYTVSVDRLKAQCDRLSSFLRYSLKAY